MTEDVGIGLIGCGSVAEWKYAENLSQLPGAALRAFFGGRSEEFRLRYGASGAAACGSLPELLARPDVDAVCVCTPNATHAEITVAALRAGKHVLCEKPMATSQTDAAAMVRSARAAGKILTVGHQGRFLPAAYALHQTLQSGEFGRLYFARASMVRRMGIPTWGHFFDPAIQGGGCLMDLGTHAIDLALWLLGDFKPAYCIGNTFRGPAEHPTAANRWGSWDASAVRVEDSAFGQIVLQSGAVLSVDVSWALHVPEDRENRLTLCGALAGAELAEDTVTFSAVRDDALWTEKRSFPGDEEAANRAQLEDFVRAIRTGAQPLVTAEQSLAVSRILSGLYRSAREGRPVIFKEEKDNA